MAKILNIVCDVDGILADMLKKWIDTYNNCYGQSVTKEQVDKWDLAKCVPHRGHRGYIYQILEQPSFFADLEILPGAEEALEYMRSKHNLRICTSSLSKNLQAIPDKIRWLVKNFNFNRKKIHITYEKEALDPDIFIDDSPKNLAKMKIARPNVKLCSIKWEYNSDKDADCMAHDYHDTAKAWAEIIAFIKTME